MKACAIQDVKVHGRVQNFVLMEFGLKVVHPVFVLVY